jgi:hypothetical protein
VDGDGLAIPESMVARLRHSRRAFFATDTVAQAKQALFDLSLFGPQAAGGGGGGGGEQHTADAISQRIDQQFPVISSSSTQAPARPAAAA